MNLTDSENLQFATTPQFVDKLNAEFYGKYPYPWPPMKFRVLQDPDFETIMLNQNLGDWDHRLIPENPKIWIAGCGANQALITAIRFPNAQVIGSDISETSLEICNTNARRLNISNLELRRESLNEVNYKSQFDYIISTGVIMVNANPEAVLKNIVRAMKPEAILELMVYNRSDWTLPANFQRAVRLLCGHKERPHFDDELAIARAIVNEFPVDNSLGRYVAQFKNVPESMFTDTLIQPVLYSYTVESFEALTRGCRLKMLQPHVSMWDKSTNTLTWNMQFPNKDIQKRYEALPDLERWKISNLLLWEKSPGLLWFYFQREDSSRPRRSEADICNDFLQRTFAKAKTTAKYFVQRNGDYVLSDGEEGYPSFAVDSRFQKVLEVTDGSTTMKEVLEQSDIELDFASVNLARINLTTSEFPFLRCVS